MKLAKIVKHCRVDKPGRFRIAGNALKVLKKMQRALKAQGPGRAAK